MLRVRPVDRDLDRKWRIFPEQLRDPLVDERSIAEDRNEKAFSLRVRVDLREITPRERFATGEGQPERARLLEDVEDSIDLGRAEVGPLIGLERDVAELASKITDRSQLEQARHRLTLAPSIFEHTFTKCLDGKRHAAVSPDSTAPIRSIESRNASTSAEARSSPIAKESIKFRAKSALLAPFSSAFHNCSAVA